MNRKRCGHLKLPKAIIMCSHNHIWILLPIDNNRFEYAIEIESISSSGQFGLADLGAI